MKRTFLCLFCVVALSSPAVAQTSGTSEITVTGRGVVALAPDLALVAATVQSNAPTAAQALAANNAAYDRIVAALTSRGIARNDVTLSGYNVSYVAPRTGQPNDERTGYTVSRDFSVRVRAMARAGDVTDACIAAGATAINGVTFTVGDSSAARAKAVALAVADARKNAEILARESALRIVGIARVALDNAGETSPVFATAYRMAARPTTFDQGNVEVSASVTAVFFARP